MLVEAPQANIGEEIRPVDPSGRKIDWVEIDWTSAAKRAFRGRSGSGREIRFLLRLGVVLRQGDVVWQSDDGLEIVAINIRPCEVLVGVPDQPAAAIALAYELGNLHVPLEWQDGRIISIDDGPVREAFETAGVAFERQTRRFQPTSRGTLQITVAENFRFIGRT